MKKTERNRSSDAPEEKIIGVDAHGQPSLVERTKRMFAHVALWEVLRVNNRVRLHVNRDNFSVIQIITWE